MSSFRHLQKDRCELFGLVGYIVQGILAIAALLTLIIKRCQEKPKRPWKVWWFDVSKQVIAALVLHIVNLILSSWLTNDEDISDECVWYFVTLFLDCTLGAFLSYILMWVVDGIAIVGNCKYIKSGLYFEEYVKDGKRKFKLIKKMYFAQLTVWLVITIINKLLLLAFVKIAKKFWENFGNFILTPFTNANVKLVVINKDEDTLVCRVINEGDIISESTINIPDIKFNINFLSNYDKEVITFAVQMQVDYLALSHVREEMDVLDINDLLISLNDNNIQIISKIENKDALEDMDKILNASDGIIISRGDLGIEISIEQIPRLQKALAKKINNNGKICIISTEMLSSMKNSTIKLYSKET